MLIKIEIFLKTIVNVLRSRLLHNRSIAPRRAEIPSQHNPGNNKSRRLATFVPFRDCSVLV